MKKRKITVLCVMALSLAVCIFACVLLSGSGNGYEKTFAALEKLLFRTDNCTMVLNAEIKIDGETYGTICETIQYDRGNRYSRDISDTAGVSETSESCTLDGVLYYRIDHENKSYKTQKLSGNSMPDNGYLLPEEGESAWRLAKLFADFVSGNAKNRFVRERLADGNRYTLSLSGEQLPEAVLLFADIFNEAGELFVPEGITVDFEDSRSAFCAYHLNTYAEALDEDFFDFCYSDPALSDAYEYERSNMMRMYEGLASGENAYIRVSADGTAQVYAGPAEYYATIPVTRENLAEYADVMLTRDVTIKNIELSADVDAEGNLAAISVAAAVGFTDFGGTEHTLEIRAGMVVSAVGETVIERFPPEGYTENREPDASYISEEITRNVRFAGTDYTVTYTKWVKK